MTSRYNKAFAAIIGALAPFVAAKTGIEMSPDLQAALAVVLAGLLSWAVPAPDYNKTLDET